MTKPTRLFVIAGRQKRASKDAKPLTCPRCNGRTTLVATHGQCTEGRKITGGSKRLICAQCLSEGVLTFLS